jgi:POT family proton-dependent oligopeptide transporter
VSSQPTDVTGFASGSRRRPGELFGHPTCLFTLFFAEMWERFSFYGMKALLILYMVNYLFWKQGEASHVMAWYAGLVYATPVLGGIIADKVTGARWAVVIGGVIIAIGHFLLAFEPLPFFYSGLACLIVGTGFLKPNISTQVGALYRSKDERRDSAFTIFYMGINLGAFIGPLVCGWLRFNYGYHYGFAAAGVGMVFGLIVYILGMQSVVRREKLIKAEEEAAEAAGEGPAAPQPEPDMPSNVTSSRVYFDRSIVLVVICCFAILFWVGFEQAANVMNLWADKHTNLHVFQGEAPMVSVAEADGTPGAPVTPAGGIANWQMTAEQSQSINPLFIIVFAGVFAWFWEFLDRRGKQPSTPLKMAFGVFFLSCAYGIMLLAAQTENQRTSAPLVELPVGLAVDEQQRVYSTVEEEIDGERVVVETNRYGATRLAWSDGTLRMNGVLTDLDWMRALAATCSESYQQTVEDLIQAAEDKAEEVRLAKQAKELARDATWEVETTVPPDAGDIAFIAGLPTHKNGKDEQQVAFWDSETRTLRLTATLSDKDQAQLLAAGSDQGFRAALTKIYKDSSIVKVSILWLLAFYLVLTIGELCLSPVGLSLVTKAAPPKYVGLFMGFWFFTTGAVSNYLAHYAGGYWGTMLPGEYFMIFGVLGIIATVIMLLLVRVLKPMLHGVH